MEAMRAGNKSNGNPASARTPVAMEKSNNAAQLALSLRIFLIKRLRAAAFFFLRITLGFS